MMSMMVLSASSRTDRPRPSQPSVGLSTNPFSAVATPATMATATPNHVATVPARITAVGLEPGSRTAATTTGKKASGAASTSNARVDVIGVPSVP